MFTAPKSLLQRWSDYRAGVPCGDAVLRAYLDDEPAVRPVSLDLAVVHSAGRRSKAARERYLACCRTLTNWCIDHGRYVHNVAVHQELGWDLDDLVSTPLSPRGREDGNVIARVVQRLFRTEQVAPLGGYRPYRHRLTGDLPCWSMAMRELAAGDLLVIDAPLGINTDPEKESTEFFLCDYPPMLRQSHDARVPLCVSTESAKDVCNAISVRTDWHPFCRLLAIVRQAARGDRLQVLQLQFRSPIPDERRYTHEPGWPESLLSEASPERAALEQKEIDWLKDFLAKTVHGGVGLESPAAQLSTASRSQLRKRLEALAPTTHFSLTRAAASPYEGVEAFWCCLAAVLPIWRDDFPLTASQVITLLEFFDSTFDANWRQVASQLEQVVDLRYTPTVMDKARATLEQLRDDD